MSMTGSGSPSNAKFLLHVRLAHSPIKAQLEMQKVKVILASDIDVDVVPYPMCGVFILDDAAVLAPLDALRARLKSLEKYTDRVALLIPSAVSRPRLAEVQILATVECGVSVYLMTDLVEMGLFLARLNKPPYGPVPLRHVVGDVALLSAVSAVPHIKHAQQTLSAFGSIAEMADASTDAIRAAAGVPASQASKVKAFFVDPLPKPPGL